MKKEGQTKKFSRHLTVQERKKKKNECQLKKLSQHLTVQEKTKRCIRAKEETLSTSYMT